MQITIRGKKWHFKFAKVGDGNVGLCDSPSTPNKTITVDPNQSELDVLDTCAHEILHAAYWDMGEEAIEEAATDLARALWRLGYRRTHD
jgi:hypothetical protein